MADTPTESTVSLEVRSSSLIGALEGLLGPLDQEGRAMLSRLLTHIIAGKGMGQPSGAVRAEINVIRVQTK